MADIYFVDFKRRTLIGKKTISPEISESDLDKYNYFSELIDRGLTRVVVNSTAVGVKLPAHLMGSSGVELNWSHKFRLSDFRYDQFKISGTLTFSGHRFFVELPWKSIWLIFRPDEGQDSVKIWISDVPKDKLEELKIKVEEVINEGEIN